MKNYKIAFCIPTYNRSSIVNEFLEHYAVVYYKLCIDIIFYDSSEDNKTEVTVKEWMTEYDNISYEPVPSNWHANHKVMQIFKQFSQEQKYDYLWLCGDTVQYDEWVLKEILDKLKLQYDILVVNGRDEERLGTKEYTDFNQFFQECAWHITLFGAVILNVRTMLLEVPWEQIQEKYEVPERINFSHVGFYFEVICRLRSFRAYHLSVSQGFHISPLKQASGWFQDAFRVLCEYWPSAINALPQCYTEKSAAINKHGYYSAFTPWCLMHYRCSHVYNIRVFWKYRVILKDMTNLSMFQLLSLACLEPKYAYFIAGNDWKGFCREISKIHHLHRFCKNHHQIYIYGAGKVAKRYANYLIKKKKSFKGFIVSSKEKNPDNLMNHTVISLNDYLASHENAGIIVGVSSQYMEEVQSSLEIFNLWEDSFHTYIFPFMLESWK